MPTDDSAAEMRRPASLAPRWPVAIRPCQARHRSPPLSPVVMGVSDRLRATQGAVGAEHGRGLRGCQVAGQVVDEPAVAVAENHQTVGLGARHGADAVVVRLPMHH